MTAQPYPQVYPNRNNMDCKEFIDIIENKLQPLDGMQKEQFRLAGELYREWNSRINVISRKDIDELYLHHFLHSLSIAGYMKTFGISAEGMHFLDLGTGGGFPGIPLAILFPQARFTLCDSIGKKIKVAEAVASGLGLKNVETVNARAEDIDGKFDYIVSRAVTSLDKFMPWVKGKYRKGILYLKGGDVVEELSLIMGKYRLRSGSIHTWRISSWTDDPYFSEKLVIFIENICN